MGSSRSKLRVVANGTWILATGYFRLSWLRLFAAGVPGSVQTASCRKWHMDSCDRLLSPKLASALCVGRARMLLGVLFGSFFGFPGGLWWAFWRSCGAGNVVLAPGRGLWSLFGPLWWPLRGLLGFFEEPWGRFRVPLSSF